MTEGELDSRAAIRALGESYEEMVSQQMGRTIHIFLCVHYTLHDASVVNHRLTNSIIAFFKLLHVLTIYVMVDYIMCV